MKEIVKGLGLSEHELAALVRKEGKKRRQSYKDDVKYAKESLASAVFRLQEAKKKAREMGRGGKDTPSGSYPDMPLGS